MRIVVTIVAVLGLAAFAFAGTAFADGIGYISSETEPWGEQGSVNALNDVHGNGNWDRLTFANAIGNGALTGDYQVLYIDGGDGATVDFQSWVGANRSAIESWVADGGCLLMGAARWNLTNDFDTGFGATLHSGSSSTGTATAPLHPAYTGPWGNTGNAFNGSDLSHDYLTGGGFTELMEDSSGRTILMERSWGSGNVILHGLTLPFFGVNRAWSANSDEFIRNLYEYNATGKAVVPEPGTLALLGLGVIGLALRRRRKA